MAFVKEKLLICRSVLNEKRNDLFIHSSTSFSFPILFFFSFWVLIIFIGNNRFLRFCLLLSTLVWVVALVWFRFIVDLMCIILRWMCKRFIYITYEKLVNTIESESATYMWNYLIKQSKFHGEIGWYWMEIEWNAKAFLNGIYLVITMGYPNELNIELEMFQLNILE